MTLDLVLESNQDTGNGFERSTPFIVFLDTYADGWFVEYAYDTGAADEDTLNWKRWHSQPLQQHGELSWVLCYGSNGIKWRLNSGTRGASARVSSDIVNAFK